MLCKCYFTRFEGLFSFVVLQWWNKFSSSVRKIMFLLQSLKSPIDLSFFLKSLKDPFIKIGCFSFDLHLHAQQDVAKVLEILLEELTGPSVVSTAAYYIESLTSIICHIRHQLNRTEQSYLYFMFLSIKISQLRLQKF